MQKTNPLSTDRNLTQSASAFKARMQAPATPVRSPLPVAVPGYVPTRSAVKSPVMIAPNALHEHRTSHILHAVPMLGEPPLDGFFGDAFGDRSLCDAYLLVMPAPVMSLAQTTVSGQVNPPRLALDLSVADMNVMLSRSGLLKHERRLGAVAAFFAPCGWYLHLNQCDTSFMGQRSNLSALRELRMEALRYPLRALRRRHPALVATLTAIWDPEENETDDVDADQVQRIRRAVLDVCGWL